MGSQLSEKTSRAPSGGSSRRRPWQAALATFVSRIKQYAVPPGIDGLLTTEDPHRFLGWCFYLLRVTTVVMLLLVTSIQSSQGRFGYNVEINILLFALYNLVLELVRRRIPALRSFAWTCILDLPVVLLVYAFGAAPGGLLFVLIFLDLICAAISMTLRGILIYTAIVGLSISLIDPTLPLWTHDAGDVRRLSGRLIILALTALGTAILTQRLQLEQAAAQSGRDEAARLTELNRLRTEFAHMVSHDLRTPLAGVRAGIGMLEASAYERLQPDEQELIASTRRNVQRLGRLIDDLLTLNQLEAGALDLSRAPFDLRKCVTEVLPTIHPLLSDNGQILEVDLPDPLPIEGDARRLEQVVINLLANAQQHTQRGTRIKVAGSATRDTIHLIVSDTGPGIPVEEHEAVFQRFYQRGAHRSGAGLGLAIVKGIVELHGGRVWVESAPGSGARFHVAMPRYRSGGLS